MSAMLTALVEGAKWRVRSFSPSCRRGSGGVRQQVGLDGLGSVPRLLLEPSSPHRSSQPALTYSRFVAVHTYGSKGLKIQYAGISTPFPHAYLTVCRGSDSYFFWLTFTRNARLRPHLPP
jgi:hypothetical protein